MNDYSKMYRIHAIQRMFERNVSVDELSNIIIDGKLVEKYKNDSPYPGRLKLGRVNNRPLHVVYTEQEVEKKVIVVTVYDPDPRKWIKNLVRR